MSSRRRDVHAFRAIAAGLALSLAIAGLPGCATTQSQQQVESAATTSSAQETGSTDAQALTKELLSSRDLDASYDASAATTIALSDAGSQVSGNGVTVDGSAVTINEEGTYVVTGALADGRLVVDAGDSAKVQLVLAGASIQTSGPTAFYVRSAKKVFLTLADGTSSTLTAAGTEADEDEHTLDGAIWSHEKLTINGTGSLAVSSASGHGIVAKDDLALVSGSVSSAAAIDAIQAKGALVIADGTYELTCGDDGAHSDADLYLLGGTVNVAQSCEGLEGTTVTIAGGTSTICSSDDGINASGTSDESDAAAAQGDQPGAMEDYDETAQVTITGGHTEISAGGDGIDSNGDLTISDGETYVSGPTQDGDGALDYAGTGTITGGVLMASGSTGMAQGLGDGSTQPSMLVSLSGSAGDTIALNTTDGETLASYTPSKSFSCVVISTPALEQGSSYTVSAGASTTTVALDSLIYSDVSTGAGQDTPQLQAPGDDRGPSDTGAPQETAPDQGSEPPTGSSPRS